MKQTISHQLKQAYTKLIEVTSDPRLEAEVLLSHILQLNRSSLLAQPEYVLTDTECMQFNQLLKRRQQSEPIAYILGKNPNMFLATVNIFIKLLNMCIGLFIEFPESAI